MSDHFAHDPLGFYLDKADPGAWKAIGALSAASAESARTAGLDRQLVELISVRVSQINGCAYCLNLHSQRAKKAGVSEQRLSLLPAWQDTEAYTDQEKAALYLAETVTLLPEGEDRDFAQLLSAGSLTDAQYSAVQWLAITMNATNRISIMSHHPVPRVKE
ncbi:carboxymuconolactone decarboxylase family protein [Rothia uropygialis]|uniref:carboxymuconolactone decarboxylase family protein n=1 Tax=Kocuria sp. 36 TaxID=1415402 RepID=UPI00101BD5C4|nr:carboxymuconolactone decarboxylase family protein [Kocuria sp. 36]